MGLEAPAKMFLSSFLNFVEMPSLAGTTQGLTMPLCFAFAVCSKIKITQATTIDVTPWCVHGPGQEGPGRLPAGQERGWGWRCVERGRPRWGSGPGGPQRWAPPAGRAGGPGSSSAPPQGQQRPSGSGHREKKKRNGILPVPPPAAKRTTASNSWDLGLSPIPKA